MQFHLNGFQPGDPRYADPQDRVVPPPIKRPLPATTDVLIVGCGPAGLNLAAQLAQFADIRTCIVDAKDDRLTVGQADGMACRTMEMFQAYGFAEQVMQEAYQVNETTFWKPDPNQPQHITRHDRIQDVEDDLSEMPHVIINQARIHDMFLDVMRRAPAKLEPFYSRKLVALQRNDADDYPLTLTFERGVTHAQSAHAIEQVKARYVVGCDGARSTVRTLIGRELVGDALNQAWGVMDVLAVTDFPDVRIKSVIQSATEGNMLIIPREGGYMFRLYIELDKLNANQRVDRAKVSADYLIAAAQRILHPYRLEVKEMPWWSVYEIGQRLATAFDDAEPGRMPRVFLAGDACHTHSPKAGQGLNTSVNDTWNLGWKMAHVLRGQANPDLLQTYSAERQDIATQLIDFDRAFAKLFSTKVKSADNPNGADPDELQRMYMQFGRFTAGTAIRYKRSTLVGDATHQALATGQVVGMRFHSAPVVRLADAKPMQLGHCAKADGRWRLYAFAGRAQPMSPACGVAPLCQWLMDSADSPVRCHTPPGDDPDAVIDWRVIFQQPHRAVELRTMVDALLPAKGVYGLRDYEKVFCADPRPHADIFDLRGIDREHGCIVVVRPDQYVAAVLPLNAYQALAQLFAQVLRPVAA